MAEEIVEDEKSGVEKLSEDGKTYTYTLSDNPIVVTCVRNAELKTGEVVQKYIDTVEYQVECTDGTYTALTSVRAGVESYDSEGNLLVMSGSLQKEKSDFVEYDDLTECPPNLYAKIITAFEDEKMREILKQNVIAEYYNIVNEEVSWG